MSNNVFRASRLAKRYEVPGRTVEVFKDLDFEAALDQITVVLGRSGCGKTTLLRVAGGLEAADAGEISGLEGLKTAFVFQDPLLMPWLSVMDNVTLPLRSAGMGKAEREAVALEALTEVGLADFTEAYPWQLSGGMQQRVAIARALAYAPYAVVMDEPFASVDAQTRADLEDLVLRVRDHLGLTVMLVTHDIDEAVYLADTVLALSGRPARVTAMLPIDLPQPRDQLSTKALPEFADLRAEVYTLIRNPATA